MEQVTQERDLLIKQVHELEEEEAALTFDSSYKYDHTNALDLSIVTLQDVENRPVEVSSQSTFNCVQRIYAQFKQDKFGHPEDFPILILACLRSTWFTANQRNCLSVMLNDAMTGCREIIKVQDTSELEEHKSRLQAALLVIRDAENQLGALNERLLEKDKHVTILQQKLRFTESQRHEECWVLQGIKHQLSEAQKQEDFLTQELRLAKGQCDGAVQKLEEITTKKNDMMEQLGWTKRLMFFLAIACMILLHITLSCKVE